jgi:hypothetical protein
MNQIMADARVVANNYAIAANAALDDVVQGFSGFAAPIVEDYYLSANDAYLNIHNGPVNWYRRDGSCNDIIGDRYPGCTAWAETRSRNLVWVFTNATPGKIGNTPGFATHELGHAFDVAVDAAQGRRAAEDLADAGLNNRNGLRSNVGPGTFQFGGNGDNEVFADTFVAWNWNWWRIDPSTNSLNVDAQAKLDFMASGMPGYVADILGIGVP